MESVEKTKGQRILEVYAPFVSSTVNLHRREFELVCREIDLVWRDNDRLVEQNRRLHDALVEQQQYITELIKTGGGPSIQEASGSTRS